MQVICGSSNSINLPAINETKQKNYTYSTDLNECYPVTISSDTLIPIFVLIRDRLSSLNESLISYKETITSPFEIIILDHGSTYPPMLEYLQAFEQQPNQSVHRLNGAIQWKRALQKFATYIDEYLRVRPSIEYYVFTDGDIALKQTRSDILLFLAATLKACPWLRQAGPALRVSDVPDHYVVSNPELKRPIEQHAWLWNKVPYMSTWKGLGYHIAVQPIDTTFAVRRRGTVFSRLSEPAVRAYTPFSAVHVDWYQNTSDLPADKIWYVNHSNGGVNHWR